MNVSAMSAPTGFVVADVASPQSTLRRRSAVPVSVRFRAASPWDLEGFAVFLELQICAVKDGRP